MIKAIQHLEFQLTLVHGNNAEESAEARRAINYALRLLREQLATSERILREVLQEIIEKGLHRATQCDAQEGVSDWG